MARPQITQIRHSVDFAQNHRWDLRFTRFPTAVAADSESLNFRCVSSTVPVKTQTPIDVNIRGHHIRVAGVTDSDHTITFSFVEDVSNTVSNVIRSWREAIWESKTGISRPFNELVATIQIIRLNNQDEPIWQYELSDCFLESYTAGDLTGEGGDLIRPEMTLSYNYFTDGAV